jgi:hypothetical protein
MEANGTFPDTTKAQFDLSFSILIEVTTSDTLLIFSLYTLQIFSWYIL